MNIKKIYPVLGILGFLFILYITIQFNRHTEFMVKVVVFSIVGLPFLSMGIYYHLQYRLEEAKRFGRIEEREEQGDEDTVVDWIEESTEEKKLKRKMKIGYVVFGVLIVIFISMFLGFMGW